MSMDRNNLLHATALYKEDAEIARALDVIDHNGTIIAVTMVARTMQQSATPPPPGEGEDLTEPMLSDDPVVVSTVGLQYPPQMIQAIRAQLQARHEAINKELTALGVAAQPVPTPAAPPARRR